MKLLDFSKIDSSQAKYLQLANCIRHAIKTGQLLPNDKLPSVKSISTDARLNRHTVMKALGELVAEGWLIALERVGYRVVENLPIEHSTSADSKNTQVQAIEYKFVRQGTALPKKSASEYAYNFSGGLPDLSQFPFHEYKRAMSDVLTRPDLSQYSYGDSAGSPELVHQLKEYLRQTRSILNRDVVVTNGSQEALYIIAQLFLQAGDHVAVEALGYPPAIAAFKSAGADLVGIRLDKNGMCPLTLEAQIRFGNIKLIYLTPLHQYPTTVTLPIKHRQAIYQLATKYKIPIVEDDYDHEFHYRCQPLAPLAADDPAQLVIYLSSFSKIMFPGARIGVMAVNKRLATAIAEYRLMISHKSNVLMQASLARWMSSGGFERHLRRTTRQNLQKRDHAVELLRELNCFEFIVPDGGMALWLKLKRKSGNITSAKALAEKALLHNICIQHQQQFIVNPMDSSDEHIRIGFAGMSIEKFATGIHKLIALLKR